MPIKSFLDKISLGVYKSTYRDYHPLLVELETSSFVYIYLLSTLPYRTNDTFYYLRIGSATDSDQLDIPARRGRSEYEVTDF